MFDAQQVTNQLLVDARNHARTEDRSAHHEQQEDDADDGNRPP
jgi:hypothetical protein